MKQRRNSDGFKSTWNEPGAAVDENAYRRQVEKWLSRRFLTAVELRERLIQKGCQPELAEALVEEAGEENQRREAVIMEDHIRRGRDTRLVGRSLLLYELSKRGIPTPRVRAALDADYPGEMEYDVALKLSVRKLMAMNHLPPEVRERRLAGTLQRRGFTSEVIARLMRIGTSEYRL